MAGLNMKIEWVTRLCKVGDELGYFHTWEQWSNAIDASPLRGGHPGGQNSQVYGIVEFVDGVRRIEPIRIKFCDEANAILNTMANPENWSRVYAVSPGEIKRVFKQFEKGENDA